MAQRIWDIRVNSGEVSINIKDYFKYTSGEKLKVGIEYKIRSFKENEKYILEDMLYEAIFQPNESELLPREVINDPEIYVYIDNFGKEHDQCFVAKVDNEIILRKMGDKE